MATLANIRKKVRKLTRSPSVSQISDADLNEYINNFLLYDFPENLRLFTFKKTLNFYTQPNVDMYDTNTVNADDPLYNFKNAYITVDNPVYVAGNRIVMSQSRDEFYKLYPSVHMKTRIGTGNGVTTLFTGTLPGVPILQNEVEFTSISADNYGITLHDVPIPDPALGVPTSIGNLILPETLFSHGTINYLTGEYTVTIPYVPGATVPVYAQTVSYSAGRPVSILYFDNKFFMRPVPDMVYKVSIETFIRPTELVNAGDIPELEQHSEYISLGAARKILIDRLDMETVALIEPEFKHQELLCQRRTIIQRSGQRVPTIYCTPDISSGGWDYNNYL